MKISLKYELMENNITTLEEAQWAILDIANSYNDWNQKVHLNGQYWATEAFFNEYVCDNVGTALHCVLRRDHYHSAINLN